VKPLRTLWLAACLAGAASSLAPSALADTYGPPIAQVEYVPPPVPIGPAQPPSGPISPLPPQKAAPETENGNRPVPRIAHVVAAGGEAAEGSATADAPPAISAFPTNLWAPDASIAVGHHYVVAANTGWITYYDKQGNQLATINPLQTSLSMNAFFAGFLNGKNANGTPNTQNINTIINLPVTPHFPKCTWTQDQSPQPAAGPEKSCVQQVYDARVQWDPWRNRFWVQAAARPLIWANQTGAAQAEDPRLVRRFEMIAVSKTEDPRMGWYQYVLVDDYADWPRMTVNGRVVALGHQGDKNVWFLDADKLAAGNPGHGSVEINKYIWRAFPESDLLAYVTAHGDTGGMTYLLGVGNGGKTWTVYGFDVNDPDHMKKASFSTNDWAPIWVRNNPIFRGGYIYVTGSMAVASNRESIRVMRIPVHLQANREVTVSTSGGEGFLDLYFGRNGPGDAPTDLVSYHVPSLEVTSQGAMVLAYTRVGVQTAKPLYPEVRYSVVTANGQIERSRLVKAAASDVEPDSIDGGGSVDLTGAAIDPVDDRTVWSINPYGDNNGYHFLVSQLRP
jgi:hypothetical protein